METFKSFRFYDFTLSLIIIFFLSPIIILIFLLCWLDTGKPLFIQKRVGKDNNLDYLFPELAKEWHPKKNGDLRPYQVTRGSDKIVWWQCLTDPRHEWQSKVVNRTKGSKCPKCRKKNKLKGI